MVWQNWGESPLRLEKFHLSLTRFNRVRTQIEHHCHDDDEDAGDDGVDVDVDVENPQEVQGGEAGEGVGLDALNLVCVDQQQLRKI